MLMIYLTHNRGSARCDGFISIRIIARVNRHVAKEGSEKWALYQICRAGEKCVVAM